MKKISLSTISPSRFVIALSLAQISSFSPLLAAEAAEKEDPHNERALRIAMSRHNLTREHFAVPEGKTVPIYDVQQHIRFQAAQIHKEQLRKYSARDSVVTPPTSPTKAAQSSPSILSNIAYYPTQVFLSPVYLVQGIYNNLPSWPSRSTPQASSTAASSIGEDFVDVKGGAKAKGTPETDAKLTPQNDLMATPTAEPIIGIVTNDEDEKQQGLRAKPPLSAFILRTPEGGDQQNLSQAVLPTYAEGDGDSGRKRSSSRRHTLIYSGDGGGARGLGPAIIMEYMRKKTGVPMSDLFDYVIGTSISGIQVLCWTINNIEGLPSLSEAETVSLMENDIDVIFPKSSPWNIPARVFGSLSSLRYTQYDSGPLELRLQRILGEFTLEKARTKVYVPILISETNQPEIINSRTHTSAVAWQIARGGSAFPTKLSAFQIESLPGKPYALDGGFSLNNPADYILDEAMTYESSVGNRDTEFVLFSAGTGRAPINPVPQNAGILNGVGPAIDAFTESQVLGTHMTLKSRLKEGLTYFRADPNLPYSIPVDTLSSEDKSAIRTAFEPKFDIVDNFVDSDAAREKLKFLGVI